MYSEAQEENHANKSTQCLFVSSTKVTQKYLCAKLITRTIISLVTILRDGDQQRRYFRTPSAVASASDIIVAAKSMGVQIKDKRNAYLVGQ